MIVTEVFIFCITFLLIKFFWDRRRFFYLASKIPKSNFDFSLKGIFKLLTADSKGLFEMSYESFENTEGTVKTWMGPVLMIIIGDPEDVKIVFNSKECIEKPSFLRFFGAPESILFGDYGPWHSHKKILNPHFNVNGVKSLIPIFNEKTKVLMENVKEMEGKGEFNIFFNFTALALETIMKVMEYDTNIQNLNKDEREAYIVNLREFFRCVSLRIFKPWLHPEFIYKHTKTYRDQNESISKTAMKFTRCIMNNAIRIHNDALNNNSNFSDDNLEVKNRKAKSFMRDLYASNLSDRDIFDEVKTIIVAAQDTTALSSSSVLLLLAMHKKIQEKVVAELHQIFGRTTHAPYITNDQINELQYLELVINETMRLLPVVPIVFRKVNEEVCLSDGIILPIGANIIIPIQRIQRNIKFWGDDAEDFKPERFEKENLQKIHSYAFLPFTKGARMCLGYRYAITLMKIQLANFLMRYEVDTSLKYNELEFELNTTMNVIQGYMISIKERQYCEINN